MENLTLKYRPHSFAEVVGQTTIVSILSRQIETKTFKQAYLFAGPSGCGKTTTARIMAKEINNGEGEPIEIDAASNNGVDNIRELIISAQQTSLDCDYSIYIIDECHMMTTAAWNALLKTLEEPPTHVIFILCTTNPNKIPETILTRVQRFDFMRIPQNIIADRLEFIANEEKSIVSSYTQDALNRIAAMSNGFMREAISLFDKCIGYSADLTLENVERTLGLVKYDLLVELNNAVIDKDYVTAQTVVSKLCSQNSSLLPVMDSILEIFIAAAKLKKFGDIKYTTIPVSYKDRVKTSDDYMFIVDRAFKYRTLCQQMDIKSVIDVLILELCNR